jgi:hypothetical protein
MALEHKITKMKLLKTSCAYQNWKSLLNRNVQDGIKATLGQASATLTALWLIVVVPFGNSFAGEPLTHKPLSLAHKWDYITFPSTLPQGKSRPTFMLRSEENQSDESRGLRLDIMQSLLEFPETNVIATQLYRENGEIVEPTALGKQGLHNRIGVNGTIDVVTYFPWGRNALKACWINVSISTEHYWLEIPYGFDRNPSDPLPPSIPGGCPRVLPAMKARTAHDHLLRWQNVHYDLGKIQSGRWLSLIQSNPGDAESEVELYDENPKPPWNLDSPRTAVRILPEDSGPRDGRCVNLHLDDSDMRRTDTFHFGRSGTDIRSWGQVEITVDDKNYRVVLPSSLYEYVHGHVLLN